MARTIPRWSFIMLLIASLSGCDDSISQPGGGPSGTPAQTDLAQGQQIGNAVSGTQIVTNGAGAGFGAPEDQLGDPSFSSGTQVARIDTDGDPNGSTLYDYSYNQETSGTIDGQPVDSSQYAYVVRNAAMAAAGIQIGDWALVTNVDTGEQVWARVEDNGPADAPAGEISEAAATAVGIQFQKNSNTTGNPMVTVQAYAHSGSIPGN
jgi:hypothetical protein